MKREARKPFRGGGGRGSLSQLAVADYERRERKPATICANPNLSTPIMFPLPCPLCNWSGADTERSWRNQQELPQQTEANPTGPPIRLQRSQRSRPRHWLPHHPGRRETTAFQADRPGEIRTRNSHPFRPAGPRDGVPACCGSILQGSAGQARRAGRDQGDGRVGVRGGKRG